MNSLTVQLARAVAFFDTAELNPEGTLYYPDLVRELVSRYEFQKFPRSVEDWKSDTGGEFLAGRIGKRVINKLLMWNMGVTVETSSNTSDSREIMEEIFGWAADKFGLR